MNKFNITTERPFATRTLCLTGQFHWRRYNYGTNYSGKHLPGFDKINVLLTTADNE